LVYALRHRSALEAVGHIHVAVQRIFYLKGRFHPPNCAKADDFIRMGLNEEYFFVLLLSQSHIMAIDSFVLSALLVSSG
jgi:hypothetical protein